MDEILYILRQIETLTFPMTKHCNKWLIINSFYMLDNENKDGSQAAEGENANEAMKAIEATLKAEYEAKLAEKDKELKTISFQKEHFKGKFEEVSKILGSNSDNKPQEDTITDPLQAVKVLEESLKVETFLRQHPELDDDDMKIIKRLKDDTMSFDDVLKSEIIQNHLVTKKSKSKLDDATPNFKGRLPISNGGDNQQSKAFKEKLLSSMPKHMQELIKNNKQ